MKKSVSDSTLDKLWSKAVKMRYFNRCAACGCNGVEAHHVVRRAKKVLRWDILNGIPLCTECHRWAHTLEGDMWVKQHVDLEYLVTHDINLADYCIQHDVTKDEFRINRRDELKKFIADFELEL